MAAGLALSSLGTIWALYIGHGLLIGFLGNGAIYAPLMVYVSRWFDRRRGTALALISSGQYIAGMIWPSVLERGMKRFGWQPMMLAYGVVVLAILPLLTLLRRRPRAADRPVPRQPALATGRARCWACVPTSRMALICVAGFCCCVPMAMPASHLVAFCGDVGITPSHGAAMLSVMLGCAFLSRQFWGAFADRFGGLRTVMAGSAFQMLAIGAFLLTRDEIGLFAIASRLRAGLQRHHPVLFGGDPRPVPVQRGVVAHPALLFTAMAAWRSAAGSPGDCSMLSVLHALPSPRGAVQPGQSVVIMLLVTRLAHHSGLRRPFLARIAN